VIHEPAVRDGEGGGRHIEDAPAANKGARHAEGLIVGQYVVGEGQGAPRVQDATAPTIAPDHLTIGDRQPCDGDRRPAADAEDPALVVAAYGQQIGVRALDVHATANG